MSSKIEAPLKRTAPRHAASTAAEPQREDFPWRWLIGLMLVATVLRAIGLNGGLWWDEIYSMVDSIRPPLGAILTTWSGDNQHPLYSILAHVCISVFGEHAWSARLPALLFGVASVPVLYLIGSLVANRREALLAAALMTVSYHHVWFSQNARGYTALAFFALLSTYFLIRGLRERRTALFIGYALAAALGVYTHLTFVFLVIGQAIVGAFLLVPAFRRELRPHARQVVTGFALAGLLSLLLYAAIMTQVIDFFLHRPSGLKGVSTPSWAVAEALRVLRIGLGANVGLAAGALLFGSGLWSYFRERRVACLLFVLPGVVTILGALAARGTMYPRYFFFLVGFGFLIAIRGAFVVGELLARALPRAGASGGRHFGEALAGIMIVVSALSLGFNYRYPKQDFGGALAYVESNARPNARIVTAGVADYPYRIFYGRSWDNIKSAQQFQRARAAGTELWVLYTFSRYLERGFPELMQVIRTECPVVRVFRGTIGGGDVVVCKPRVP